MDKVYVVMSLGFEYNDEYYYQPECGGGHPEKYYTSKEKADVACAELNENARKCADPCDYSCDYSDDMDMNEVTFFEVVEVPLG